MNKFIRNFAILSHVDHGKSTLVDRLFELASKSTVPQPQFLDQMDLERERGVTIKLSPLRMKCLMPGLKQEYVLNLIDTPGHVDFADEVARSLGAVEGAILLVDAVKGVQAQTISNLEMAQKLKLTIIPVINKIDLASARIEKVKQELTKSLGCSRNEALEISAKFGTNVSQVLEAIIKKIPAPNGSVQSPLKTYVFDAVYDNYHGIIHYLKVEQGILRASQNKEIGIFTPEKKPVEKLYAGEIGYQITGIKSPVTVNQGDFSSRLSGWTSDVQPGRTVVFANLFGSFPALSKALWQLKLNDAALSVRPFHSNILGRGFRCGFLGMFHLEIVLERLKREYELKDITVTPPTVRYNKQGGITKEPWVCLNIITRQKELGSVWRLLSGLAGEHKTTTYLSETKLLIRHITPLREVITDFYDKLKSATAGFASMDYKLIEERPVDLVQLNILIAGQKQEALSQLVPKQKAEQIGREIVKRLKNLIPAQQFAVPLQAAIGEKIIARETIRARRKDVTAPLYGGDYTRKKKLLQKQRKGKKKLAQKGQLKIPAEVFIKLFQKQS